MRSVKTAVPDDLRAALDAAKVSAAFDALPPSHQSEYLRWIDEAKRPATRATRVNKTVERVAAKSL